MHHYPLNKKQTKTAFEIQTREFPISWYGTLDVLEEMPHAIQGVCLAIDLADIVSKTPISHATTFSPMQLPAP